MARKKIKQKRKQLPDTRYQSMVISRFVSMLMLNGKKTVAEKIIYGALEKAASTLGVSIGKPIDFTSIEKDSLETKSGNEDEDGETSGSISIAPVHPCVEFLEKGILDKVRPTVELRSRRVGGATYQIPIEVNAERATALAFRWIINAARAKRGQSMQDCLHQVLVDSHKGIGEAVKKREDTHRMADANKAFIHFRW